MVEAAENRKAKITMKIPNKKPVYEAAGISMEFDFFIYVSIFLTSFGHNLGTCLQHSFCLGALPNSGAIRSATGACAGMPAISPGSEDGRIRRQCPAPLIGDLDDGDRNRASGNRERGAAERRQDT